jgi:hypothetical protein
VHVSRVRNAFDDLGAAPLYRVGLKLLSLLGEAEPLFGGYWLIAPFRVLSIESRHAFVGSLPSESGRLGKIKHSGLARFIAPQVAAQFQTQSVEGWMGASPAPRAYLQDFVSAHGTQAAPAINSPEIEFLQLIRKNAFAVRAVWAREPSAILPQEKLAICRLADHGIHRYFSAELSKKSITTEATLHHSIPRLVYALASEAGTPFKVECTATDNGIQLVVPERLPAEEFRLALLIASQTSRQGSTTNYLVDSEIAALLVNKLRNLGGQVECNS